MTAALIPLVLLLVSVAMVATIQVLGRLVAMDYLAEHMAAQTVEPWGWPVRTADLDQARDYLRRTLLPWAAAGFAGWLAVLLVAWVALEGRLP